MLVRQTPSNISFSSSSILPTLPHGDTLHHQPSAPDVLGCVVHSFIHPRCRSSQRSLIEYCSLGLPVHVGENTILSNVTLLTYAEFDQHLLELPANLIMQTIPLRNEQFATFAFGFHDNMKAVHGDLDKMIYFGQTLDTLAKKIHRRREDLFTDEANRSLWTLKIFPVTSNPNESFEKTLQLILGSDLSISGLAFVSMKDILQLRDISLLIQYRSNLINCT